MKPRQIILASAFLLLSSLLIPIRAQRLGAAQPSPFWSLAPGTGIVHFDGYTHLSKAPTNGYAQHVRQWLTANCSEWSERASGDPMKFFFLARMKGVHPGVELRYQLGIKIDEKGFRYILTTFRVGAPNGQGTMFWHDLHRLLDDPDFKPDVDHFQVVLQRALPNL